MSFNNHDADDPNGKKYGQRNKVIASIVNDVNDDDEDFEFMQIFLMAKAMKYTQWKLWIQKNHPKIHELYLKNVKHDPH